MDLRELQQRQGGVLSGTTAFPVLHFGTPSLEYARANQTAVLFDLGQRTLIEITGKDRAKFLHNFCTNDIKKLEPGRSCEAFATNVKARVLGHLFVFAEADSLWVESVEQAGAILRPHLDRYIITEEVTLHERSGDYDEFYLSGPDSVTLLQAAGLTVADLPVHQHATVNTVRIARLDWLGTTGFLLTATHHRATDLWKKLTEAGATPAGSEAFHPLRIEAGFPLYGQDITDEHLAPEAGRSALAISYTKGCYLGQEPIARIDALGHVNRTLRGIRLEGEHQLPPATPVTDADGKALGEITSSALIPGQRTTVALGYLKATHANPGSEVQAISTEGAVKGTIFWPH